MKPAKRALRALSGQRPRHRESSAVQEQSNRKRRTNVVLFDGDQYILNWRPEKTSRRRRPTLQTGSTTFSTPCGRFCRSASEQVDWLHRHNPVTRLLDLPAPEQWSNVQVGVRHGGDEIDAQSIPSQLSCRALRSPPFRRTQGSLLDSSRRRHALTTALKKVEGGGG